MTQRHYVLGCIILDTATIDNYQHLRYKSVCATWDISLRCMGPCNSTKKFRGGGFGAVRKKINSLNLGQGGGGSKRNGLHSLE